MDALKKFLNKKKSDKKFKSAGPGHKLTDASSSSKSTVSSPPSRPPRSNSKEHSEERRAAVEAAMLRVQKQKNAPSDLLANRQMKFIQEQVRKEIEAERKLKEEEERNGGGGGGGKSNENEEEKNRNELKRSNERKNEPIDPSLYAVSGVFFTCPIVGPAVGTLEEIQESIYEFLKDQSSEELGVTSCLLIHSCNRGREKIQTCVETLCKYLDNIIAFPSDPKYRRIRLSNKVYSEKVAPMRGSEEFLISAGFTKNDGVEFWSLDESEGEGGRLTELRDTLQSTSPIKAELDRNLQVLLPAQVTKRRELPPDFYELSSDEVRREQRLRAERVEKEEMLRTKAMRERDEAKEERIYRFALVRIRFPDGFTLQGTFKSSEKVGDIYAFVEENLSIEEAEFSLRKSGGEVLGDMDVSLAQAKIPPASILNFKLEIEGLDTEGFVFLKPEIMALVKTLD